MYIYILIRGFIESGKGLREISKFQILVYTNSESFIPSIHFNSAPVCANVNFQVKFSLPSLLLTLPQDQSLSQFLPFEATRSISTPHWTGYQSTAGLPPAEFSNSWRITSLCRPKGNLISVSILSTLVYFLIG